MLRGSPLVSQFHRHCFLRREGEDDRGAVLCLPHLVSPTLPSALSLPLEDPEGSFLRHHTALSNDSTCETTLSLPRSDLSLSQKKFHGGYQLSDSAIQFLSILPPISLGEDLFPSFTFPLVPPSPSPSTHFRQRDEGEDETEEDEEEECEGEELTHALVSLTSPPTKASWLAFWKGLARVNPNSALVFVLPPLPVALSDD
jgi:hypothetical protein